MKIAITSEGKTLSSKVDDRFGRAPYFIIVDTDTLGYKVIDNIAASQTSGAGTKAAEILINEGVKALISSNLGSNAREVLKAANIPVYKAVAGDVRNNVEIFLKNRLEREI
ncbi:NifB/NifX family molybdenum-iron cluster-binding protein [Caldanaerobacter subterraneus]|uniref:NifB/NifX family molybdenum-iron cluster-binding protein n=1 Tax=Caldanaerobacter subterraneus TaxID=911092 RepID=UPI003463942B